MSFSEFVKSKITGKQISEAELTKKKIDLAVVSTAHNFAEIAAAVLLLFIMCEHCHTVGLNQGGAHEDVMSPFFKSRASSEDAADNLPMQAAIGLVLVTLCRMAFTAEEKIAASALSRRHRHPLRLMSTEGPERFRMTALFIARPSFSRREPYSDTWRNGNGRRPDQHRALVCTYTHVRGAIRHSAHFSCTHGNRSFLLLRPIEFYLPNPGPDPVFRLLHKFAPPRPSPVFRPAPQWLRNAEKRTTRTAPLPKPRQMPVRKGGAGLPASVRRSQPWRVEVLTSSK